MKCTQEWRIRATNKTMLKGGLVHHDLFISCALYQSNRASLYSWNQTTAGGRCVTLMFPYQAMPRHAIHFPNLRA